MIKAGRGVEFIKVGDLCSVPFKIACGRCRNCKEGKTGICLNVNPDRPGAAYASLAQARSFGCETIDVGQGDPKDQIADLLGVPEVDCGVDAVGFEARGQDLNYRAVEPQSEPLPGQRQAGADDAVAEADVARGVYSPVDLDNVPGRGRKRRWPGGLRFGRRQEGQVVGVEAGRQGLDAAPAEQDVDLAEPGPEPDGAPGYRRAEPGLLSRDPEVPRRRNHPVQLHGL